MNAPLLAVAALTKRFGGLTVLDKISLEVAPGQIHGVIGPNGAGKTTLFNVINGIYGASAGRVTFRGRDITNRSVVESPARARPHLPGTARVQRDEPARQPARADNLRRLARRAAEARAFELLELAGLAELRHQVAVEISGGQKKLLEFMRTMMVEPDLILLDEPFGGINPALAERLTEIVLRLNAIRARPFS